MKLKGVSRSSSKSIWVSPPPCCRLQQTGAAPIVKVDSCIVFRNLYTNFASNFVFFRFKTKQVLILGIELSVPSGETFIT